MAKVSGLGGFWVVAGTPNVVAHNAEYELDIESINDDVTTSGSVGYDEGLPIIKHFNSATMNVPEDDAAYVEALGLEEGTVVAVWFKRGDNEIYDKVTNSIVKSVRHTNNQKQARRLSVTLEYGSFERVVTAPVIS
jgi:hypothetical protein